MGDCPHLRGYKVDATLLRRVAERPPDQPYACLGCGEESEVWLCLECGHCGCGRYGKGHALEHSTKSTHLIAMNTESLECHCYGCDCYVGELDPPEDVIRIRKAFFENPRRRKQGRPKGSKSKKRLLAEMEDSSFSSPSPACRIPDAKRSVGQTGLRNLGNTCFMNAVLQSLSNTDQFRRFFLDAENDHPPAATVDEPAACVASVEKAMGPAPKRAKTALQVDAMDDDHAHAALSLSGSAGHSPYVTRRRNSVSIPTPSDISLSDEIRKVFRALWGMSEHGRISSYSPDSLLSTVWKFVPRFRGYQQQDAHEFLRYLLDRLHSELGPRVSDGRASIPSVVEETFQGDLLNEVRCLTCAKISRKHDPFLDLSLDIPERFIKKRARGEPKTSEVCQLRDCLASFTNVEQLEDSELYKCDHCRKRQSSTKKFSIASPPNVLCIHLKRFTWASYPRTKIDAYVEFPLKGLEIGDFCVGANGVASPHVGAGCVYDLIAVVVHHGAGAGSGHYTAFSFDERTGEWYDFNDCNVSVTTAEHVAESKAYILFYKRRGAGGVVVPASASARVSSENANCATVADIVKQSTTKRKASKSADAARAVTVPKVKGGVKKGVALAKQGAGIVRAAEARTSSQSDEDDVPLVRQTRSKAKLAT